MAEPRLIAIMGPTASGKSALAEALADYLDAVLINADAYQAYRGLDVGTAKPTRRDRYELLDIKDPVETYGVGEFVERAHQVLVAAYAKNQSVVVVGGTGLYIRALFEEYDTMLDKPDEALRAELNRRHIEEGLPSLVEELERRDPEAAFRIDRKNPARVKRALERLEQSKGKTFPLPPFRKFKFALDPAPEDLGKRIEQRFNDMVQNGWFDEVRQLRSAGVPFDAPGMRAIGYRDLWRVLNDEIGRDDAMANVVQETRRYAKRQRTWLRSEPHRIDVHGAEAEAQFSWVRTYIESEEFHGQGH